MHCKSISQVQSGAYSELKVISLVEHIQRSADSSLVAKSELLDKQVYVQIEILKITFRGSRKPTKKVCNENESKKKKQQPRSFFVVEGGIYKVVFQYTISILNEGTNF